jgi:hypothetical protein
MKEIKQTGRHGFMESAGMGAFTANRKSAVIARMNDALDNLNPDNPKFPSLSDICKTSGISLGCHYYHLSKDSKYKKAFNDIRDRVEAMLEALMISRAVEGKGGSFMWAIAWLRANNPDKWNPSVKVQSAMEPISISLDRDRMKKFQTIDADIVPEMEGPKEISSY